MLKPNKWHKIKG